MGHFGQIGDDRNSGNILAQAQGQQRLFLLKITAFQDLPQIDHGDQFIGHLDPQRGFAGDRSLNADQGRRQIQGQIVGEADNPTDLDPRLRLDLKSGHRRTGLGIDHTGFYPEALQGILEQPGPVLDIFKLLSFRRTASFCQ